MTADTASRGSAPGEKGLRTGTLGLLSTVVIGVSSTAPGYSIAATLGAVVAIIGFHSPGSMLVAFIPMLLIAFAYRELNTVDPDCGTTFTWATRAFGPWVGWMGGWGIIASDVIVMASLSQIAGSYVFLLFGAEGLAANTFWVTFVGVIWIVLLTYVCYRGIEVSAIFQFVMLVIEIIALSIFSIVALIKVYSGHAASTSVHPKLGWLNPWDGSFSHFSSAFLLVVFIYWGWDTAVAVNEETADKEKTPGRAAVLSTVILLGIYAVVSIAALAFAGPKNLVDHQDDVLGALANSVLGSGFGKIVILAVLTSAAASTQTTILPTARTTLSMSAYQALPAPFARIHPRNLTPTVSTIGMGAVSIAFYVVLASVSSTVLADSALAVGLLIAFYYGLTGFACVWFFRHQLRDSAHDLIYKGIFPLLGALILFVAFIKTASDTSASDYGDTSFHGLGGVFLISIGSLVIGLIVMLITAWRSPAFFSGRVLTRATPIRIIEGAPAPFALSRPGDLALPDSAAQEPLIEPPLSEEKLREAAAEGRRERDEDPE
jgi:amino acid transporter